MQAFTMTEASVDRGIEVVFDPRPHIVIGNRLSAVAGEKWIEFAPNQPHPGDLVLRGSLVGSKEKHILVPERKDQDRALVHMDCPNGQFRATAGVAVIRRVPVVFPDCGVDYDMLLVSMAVGSKIAVIFEGETLVLAWTGAALVLVREDGAVIAAAEGDALPGMTKAPQRKEVPAELIVRPTPATPGSGRAFKKKAANRRGAPIPEWREDAAAPGEVAVREVAVRGEAVVAVAPEVTGGAVLRWALRKVWRGVVRVYDLLWWISNG